ncbi:G1 family glutamic endopeptidase [Streptomyces roseochromogenus]|uniref:Peptidase A4 family protein n=1 Tax=Streptomyces roseochromogenus subsp. oscitans DS 12.976 TaxID=1352936 RepID=V6JQ26_STRRC|nr:G1 family glutamic endopeptidase [Streptomyces roseochromogenus]EST18959.1 hypothetical protein M878_44390 [Streptomyces roseochromogenus subsp. oscitans DS 12.976]
MRPSGKLGICLAPVIMTASLLGAGMPATAAADPLVLNPASPDSTGATSPNWFGYAASGGGYSSVESTWTQSPVDCSRGDGSVVFWVGLDGWGSRTVEQTGTGADCQNGRADYYAWWETYPDNPINPYNDPVKPGDTFYAKVTYQGGTNYELYIEDKTAGWREDQVVQGASGASNASAEVVGETPGYSGGRYASLPDFSTENFTGSLVDGKPIGEMNARRIDLARNGDTLATTSDLSNGTDFAVSWQANSLAARSRAVR